MSRARFLCNLGKKMDSFIFSLSYSFRMGAKEAILADNSKPQSPLLQPRLELSLRWGFYFLTNK